MIFFKFYPFEAQCVSNVSGLGDFRLADTQGLYILPFLRKKTDTNQQHSSFPLAGFMKMGVLLLSVCQH